MILNPVMLELSLRNIWSVAGYALEDKTLSNKYVKTSFVQIVYSFAPRNYRFAAYCNLCFFLFPKDEKKKNCRTALPSCLVETVISKFPEASGQYVGFKRKKM